MEEKVKKDIERYKKAIKANEWFIEKLNKKRKQLIHYIITGEELTIK